MAAQPGWAATARRDLAGGLSIRLQVHLQPGQVTDALNVCASLWQQGFLHAGPRGAAMPATAPSPGADNPVPPLVACVMPDGIAAIFPGTKTTCATLKLPNASS